MRTDGDYISRKTAYQFFKDQLEEETGAYSKGRNAGLRVAMSAVMNIDVIPAADVLPRWIPAAERLPEQGKRYLVIRFDEVTKTQFIDILWHDAHDLWWNRLYKGQYNVTHWMPLPQGPEEET